MPKHYTATTAINFSDSNGAALLHDALGLRVEVAHIFTDGKHQNGKTFIENCLPVRTQAARDAYAAHMTHQVKAVHETHVASGEATRPDTASKVVDHAYEA